jgi:hypothetical protein
LYTTSQLHWLVILKLNSHSQRDWLDVKEDKLGFPAINTHGHLMVVWRRITHSSLQPHLPPGSSDISSRWGLVAKGPISN